MFKIVNVTATYTLDLNAQIPRDRHENSIREMTARNRTLPNSSERSFKLRVVSERVIFRSREVDTSVRRSGGRECRSERSGEIIFREKIRATTRVGARPKWDNMIDPVCEIFIDYADQIPRGQSLYLERLNPMRNPLSLPRYAINFLKSEDMRVGPRHTRTQTYGRAHIESEFNREPTKCAPSPMLDICSARFRTARSPDLPRITLSELSGSTIRSRTSRPKRETRSYSKEHRYIHGTRFAAAPRYTKLALSRSLSRDSHLRARRLLYATRAIPI